MRIIICGAGRVGQGLAVRLLREKHTITFIDTDPVLVNKVATELDVQAVEGQASHPDILAQAGAKETDAIIAVTLSDEINMVICHMAQTVFGIQRKIARIRQAAYLDPSLASMYGRDGFNVDLIISPELEVAEAVLQRLDIPGSFLNRPMCENLVRALGLQVDGDFPLLGTAVSEIDQIFPDFPASIMAIIRDNKVITALADVHIQMHDRLYVLVLDSELERVLSILGQAFKPAKHVIIVGAGNIGLEVTQRLEKRGIRGRLIEANANVAEAASAQLNRTIVLHGDGMNSLLLEEAGVEQTDAVLALTNDDKSNLLITNFAAKFGAKSSLALINDPRLAEFSRDLLVSPPLDPRALTISKVLRSFRHGNLQALLSVEDGQAEIVEGKVSDKSPLLGYKILDIEADGGFSIGAIVRKGEVSFANSDRTIEANDHVIAFFESNQLHRVETFFRVDAGFF